MGNLEMQLCDWMKPCCVSDQYELSMSYSAKNKRSKNVFINNIIIFSQKMTVNWVFIFKDDSK